MASIKAAEIAKQPVNNPLLSLQGRVPGLFITQNNGFAGGEIKVRIQERNSINNGNGPLYVVDGVPFPFNLQGTSVLNVGSTNALYYINPADIASIDVLKDADATAIYGSRAANGAILITTKKGKEGAMRVEFNIQQGWKQVGRKLTLLNTPQYLEMRREAFKNDGIEPTEDNAPDLLLWDTTRFTDWQKN